MLCTDSHVHLPAGTHHLSLFPQLPPAPLTILNLQKSILAQRQAAAPKKILGETMTDSMWLVAHSNKAV